MTFRAHYWRYKAPYVEECDTLNEALNYLAWGEEHGSLTTDPDHAVTDEHGNVLATKDDVMRRWAELE